MTRGCVCDWLGIDGIKEIDMTNEQRLQYFYKICDRIPYLKDGDSSWFNQFLQWVVEEFGDYEVSEHQCECCGDYVETYTLEVNEC